MNCEILEKLLELGQQYDTALDRVREKYLIVNECPGARTQAERIVFTVNLEKLRAAALAKLTEEERMALGWKST